MRFVERGICRRQQPARCKYSLILVRTHRSIIQVRKKKANDLRTCTETSEGEESGDEKNATPKTVWGFRRVTRPVYARL